MPDQVYSVQWNGSEKLGFAYDNLGRLAQKSFCGNSFGIKYAYENYEIAKAEGAAEKRTTTLVKSVETPAGTYLYEYDKLGNIISVANGSYVTSYEYDSLNQLTRVNDEKAGKTITYSYTNGNITEQKEYEYTTGELGEEIAAKTWSYTDSVWSDLLTDFNGTQIAYDEIGNPLSISSKQLTWLGRQLQSIADGENTIEYAYNGDGNRISKTVNGVKTEFVYNGDILAGQKSGNDTLVFMYDNNSDIFGFILNGTEYYYIKNAQNDVTAIADKDGNVLVNYAYDAWGKVTEITGNTALAEQNPIRYRSYYFDFETEWYFLNTRYYSPDMCRFINADGYVQTGQSVLDKNMFSYCGNNPSSRIDEYGTSWKSIKKWFSNVWSKTKSLAKRTFGAGYTMESHNEIDEKEHFEHLRYAITVKTGAKMITKYYSSSGTKKPVSVYGKLRVDKMGLSSGGVKINIKKLSFNMSLGLDDMGLSVSHTDEDVTNTYGVKINASELKIGFDVETATKIDDFSTKVAYTNASITFMGLLALYCYATTGQDYTQFIYEQQPAYNY